MDVERLEIDLLFEALHRRYGYDFRQYSYPSARRRVLQQVAMGRLDSIGALQHRALHDPAVADALLRALSINVTEMFRDPALYVTLREQVLPGWRHREHVKIWHAGCASGEEVYSMAILLREEGLYECCQLFGTDFNGAIVEQARRGILPVDQMRQNVRNYQAAGGKGEFADYYRARYEVAVLDRSLAGRVRFSVHDLARDGAFGEMQMVLCRNVLIYFDRPLKDRVLNLFAETLTPGGILCLGTHETLRPSRVEDRFEVLCPKLRIYRKREGP